MPMIKCAFFECQLWFCKVLSIFWTIACFRPSMNFQSELFFISIRISIYLLKQTQKIFKIQKVRHNCLKNAKIITPFNAHWVYRAHNLPSDLNLVLDRVGSVRFVFLILANDGCNCCCLQYFFFWSHGCRICGCDEHLWVRDDCTPVYISLYLMKKWQICVHVDLFICSTIWNVHFMFPKHPIHPETVMRKFDYHFAHNLCQINTIKNNIYSNFGLLLLKVCCRIYPLKPLHFC